MILHYYSKRGSLLVPLVVGVVKEVARYHFDVLIDMVMLTKQDEDGASHTRYVAILEPFDELCVATTSYSFYS